MALAKPTFSRDSTYDGFLFAVVGEERNGMSLTVVSALARLGLDPWIEAAALRRLSAKAAAERLTASLASLPPSQLSSLPPATVARLMALLPRANPASAWTLEARDR